MIALHSPVSSRADELLDSELQRAVELPNDRLVIADQEKRFQVCQALLRFKLEAHPIPILPSWEPCVRQ